MAWEDRGEYEKSMTRLAILVLSFCFASLASAQLASPWQSGARSMVRLAGESGLNRGHYEAGAEIKLSAKTITYWRTPGEAGVPPVFDFSQSQNVGRVQVRYPVPRRIAEAGGVEAFGYEDSVIFPLAITPENPLLPVLLVMDLKYAACEKICIPEQATAELKFEVVSSYGPVSPDLADARNKVPSVMTAADRQPPEQGKLIDGKRVWTFPARHQPQLAERKDLFAEGPDGWFFETRPGPEPGEFHVILLEQPKDWKLPFVRVQLTEAGVPASFETSSLLSLKDE